MIQIVGQITVIGKIDFNIIMKKKELIIKAFEEMDISMLEILLNENQSYQDVDKKTFLDVLTDYFLSIKKDPEQKLDFKAVPGICDQCKIGNKGYSFVNSIGESYMSMIFEETEDDFSDIYKCNKFKVFNDEIKEEWLGIYFYKDDHVDYIPTAKNISEMKKCEEAVREVEYEIQREGILSKNFYIPFMDKYGHLYSFADAAIYGSYRYKKQVSKYMFVFEFQMKNLERTKIAKIFYEEFLTFSKINRETIQDWLIRCDSVLPYMKYGFEYETYPKEGYFLDRGIKINLSDFFYLQNVSTILHKYFDWIPEKNPLIPIPEYQMGWEDEEDQPF